VKQFAKMVRCRQTEMGKSLHYNSIWHWEYFSCKRDWLFREFLNWSDIYQKSCV